MKDRISRRLFLAGAVAAPLAAAKDTALPTRTLGRTGEKVTVVALGCGSRLLSYKEQDKAVEAVHLSFANGVRYIDTAQDYGRGVSETWVGAAIKGRPKDYFLATKTGARTADDVFRRLEESLKRLGVDQVDLLHLHGLRGADDLAAVEKEKVMEAMYKVREQKMARFLGITSHTDPTALAEALGRYDVDCTQMALNAALQGMQNGKGKMILNPGMATSFEEVALPVAKKKNLGVLAMKAFGQEDLLPKENQQPVVSKLLRYSLSLPVASAVCGMPDLRYIRENTAIARSFEPLSSDEMRSFSAEMSEKHKMALDLKFQSHQDV